MSGVDREMIRVKATGEVFTPTPLVEEILNKMKPEIFKDPTKTFLDPTCGDGQFLASVLYRKLENGIDFETALSTIYGVDLMQDNVELCRERLLCGRDDLKHIVEQNIVCADALTYHYRFDGTAPDITDRDLVAKANNIEVDSNIQKQPKEPKEKLTADKRVLNKYF